MAQTKVTKPGITDDAVTTAKILDDAVTTDKILNDAVTTTKILDDNVTTAKILDLNVTGAKIAATTIDVTTKITGKVPAANLGTGTASSSTYLAGDQTYKALSEFDDDDIKNDIATLALHQATNANAAKYNLVNTNVDQYEDSTGIASFTDCSRDTSGEYVSTVGEGTARFTTTKVVNAVYSTAQKKFGTGSLYNPANGDYLKTSTLTGITGMPTTGNWTIDVWAKYGGALSGADRIVGATTGAGANQFSFGYSATTNMNYYESGTNHCITYPTFDNDWHLYSTQSVGSGTTHIWYDGVHKGSFTNAASTLFGTAGSFFQMGGRGGSAGEYFIGYLDEIRISNIHRYTASTSFTPPTAAYTADANTMGLMHMNTSDLVDSSIQSTTATGNYISTATTANASVSSMGAVITYKNESGTNTLNTDIVLEVSANGGTNYTTAVLTAGGTFSTGILQAVVNDISVTAGTSIQYRISFANQSGGSKEARIYGASLMY